MKAPLRGNLFASPPAPLPAELVETLAETAKLRLERIVSRGHASPPGFWYDQDWDEWVAVLRGQARLQFADGGATVSMGPGDFVVIPAHRKHRVEWTDPAADTVWLAAHYQGDPP